MQRKLFLVLHYMEFLCRTYAEQYGSSTHSDVHSYILYTLEYTYCFIKSNLLYLFCISPSLSLFHSFLPLCFNFAALSCHHNNKNNARTHAHTVGSKEVFEPCVTAVKAFLAGEPFSEFESSMYFHRYVCTITNMKFCFCFY